MSDGALSPAKVNINLSITKKLNLEKFKECPKCKYKLLFKEAKYCSNCGAKLDEKEGNKDRANKRKR